MMTTIRLAGPLGERFGPEWNLDLDHPSPGEAGRALSAIIPGFRQHMFEHSSPGFHVFVGDDDIGEDELSIGCGGKPITIMPALVGAGGEMPAGGWQIIAGALITAAGVVAAFVPGGQGVAWPLAQLGLSLVLGGVSQLLSTPPDATPSNELERKDNPSYNFNGPINTMAQGNPVPICYGELEVGSQVISAGIQTEWNMGAGGFGNGETSPQGPDGPPGRPGGSCPAPWVVVTLDNGRGIQAGQLKPGMKVRTQHETTLEWGDFEVESVEIVRDALRYNLAMEDGRLIAATPNHRMYVVGKGWKELQDIVPGDAIVGEIPGIVKSCQPTRSGPVVRVSVPGARTYQTAGLLSHNIKKTGPYPGDVLP